MDEENPFDVTCYIPCHFDFSQIEHVAPFLERFGGTILMYKWHGLKDKMTKYYQENYDGNVKVIEFSLVNIVRSILQEKKKVVFLLTASMAYPFGTFQKDLLMLLQKMMPDRIGAVSVIGHCMYGCMSCKGIDHRVPVYFTRFFNNKLPYNTQNVEKQYIQPHLSSEKVKENSSPKMVLVAPSIGETTMVQQRPILELLSRLQDTGKFRFVFKMHPSVYNPAEYDLQYAPNKVEYDNVQYIMKTFTVTAENQPCLLPFLESFDIILSDLHSTVPFMASYFAPKIILTYHNDADYEAERDPKFLENLNIFVTPEELEALLDRQLTPKGDRSFFQALYGAVDGREEIRFASLCQWPKKTSENIPVKDQTLRQVLSVVAREWRDILKSCTDDDREDCLNALGFSSDTQFDLKDDNEISDVGDKGRIESIVPPGSKTLRVMTFNLWIGGEMGGQPLEQTANVIKAAGADIVGMQEIGGQPDANGNRPDHGKGLAAILGWDYVYQGLPYKNKGCIHPTGIISRYKIVHVTPSKWGVKVAVDPENNGTAFQFYLFNTHLAYFPYQPYQLLNLPYEDAPFLKTEEEAVESAIHSRSEQIELILSELRPALNEGLPVFLTGDFNEPSCLDWTVDTAIAGVHPIKVAWPSTKSFLSMGLQDAYRTVHKDELSHPGFSWTPRTKEDDPKDHHDRIDLIFYGGKGIQLHQVEMIGENNQEADVVVTPWPSDHRAFVATFILSPQ